MTGAGLGWFLFSSGGITVVLLAGALWLWARPASKGPRVFLLTAAVAYTLAGLSPVPRAVGHLLGRGFHALERNEVPAGRSVVVLLASGSHTRTDWAGGTVSVLDTIGAERTLEASRVFHLVHADWVISSGGPIDADEKGEAPSGQTMRDVLGTLGVPPDRILVEGQSRNTHDEAVIVADMLRSLHVDHVILVTSEADMRRSMGAFRAVGLNAIPAIARGTSSSQSMRVVPTQNGLQQSALVAHELGGLVYYWLRGWYK